MFTMNASGSNVNIVAVQHKNNGQLLIVVYNSSGGIIFSTELGMWSPTAGQVYEIEFNYDTLSGASRLFIDGVKFGSTETSTGARTTIDVIKIGTSRTSTLDPDFSIGGIQIFEEPQHTTDDSYTPIILALYNETQVDLPQFLPFGGNPITAYNSFVVSETNTPRYTISIDGGTHQYWSGVSWVDSDGTYTQSNTAAIINANIGSLPLASTSIDMRIHFHNETILANIDAISNLTINYDTISFPSDNPIITPVAGLDASAEEGGIATWDTIAFTEVKAGSDEIKYILSDDDGSTFLYWSGAAWVASDLSYAQSNPGSVVVTNFGTFPIANSKLLIRAFLHSDDSTTTPQLDNIQIDYTTDGSYPLTNPTITPVASINASVEGGVSAWTAFVESVTTPASTAVTYILSFDGGTTWYWYNSGWVVSNETFAESNGASGINTNIPTFPTTNDQIMVRAFLNTTDPDVTPLLNNIQVGWNTVGALVKTNPTVIPNTQFRTDTLTSIVETSVKPGTSELKYTLGKDGVHYYWDGVSWVVADGTYNQSNTAAEINTNVGSFTTTDVAGVDVEVKIFIHTENDGDFPTLDSLVLSYEFTGDAEDTISKCSVFGYLNDANGDPITDTFTVQLSVNSAKYKTNSLIQSKVITVTPNTDGYFEINLVENDNMDGNAFYIFDINGRQLNLKVPDAVSKSFVDLVPVR
jgi:hypothetical protein